MRTLETLMREAHKAAEFRGHKLGQWEKLSPRWNNRIWVNQCVKCEMYVEVNIKPLPNEIDVGGTVVALNCAE